MPPRPSVDDSHALMNRRTKTDIGFVVLGYNPDGWARLGYRIVSQENIPRILPLGFVFHALAGRRRRTSAVLFSWDGLGREIPRIVAPATRWGRRTESPGGRTGKVVQKLRVHERLSRAFIAACGVRRSSEQAERKRYPSGHSPGSNQGLLKRLRIRQRGYGVYRSFHYLQPIISRGNDSRNFFGKAKFARSLTEM